MTQDDFYGDKFRWFVGVVKDIADDRDRVRVRIFGIHHTEDVSRVSDGDLPWALVLYPTTGGQTSGGNVSHGLVPGTWVFGFFADSLDSQQPVIVGVINGAQGSLNNSPPYQRSIDPATGAENPQTGPVLSPTTTVIPGGTNVQKTYNYFFKRIKDDGAYTGDLKAMSAALVGNFQQEAGRNIDPNAYNPADSTKSGKNVAPAYGIAQWRYDRAVNMFKFAGSSFQPITSGPGPRQAPQMPPLETQLDFVWHELKGNKRSAYNKIITASNVSDAVEGCCFYEVDSSVKDKGKRVDRNDSSYKNKLRNAQNVYASTSYTGGDA